jgi:hypothetical protein
MRKFLLFLAALPAFAFPNGYTYCKVVTIATYHGGTGGMVSGGSDLANYPLLLTITDNDLKLSPTGLVNSSLGYDIGIGPDCSGVGSLFWDQKFYDGSAGTWIGYVLRPTLPHAADDTVGLYYGGAFSSYQSTRSSVWNANYKGVWNLGNGSTLSGLDSTSNGFNLGTSNAGAGTGEIDGTATFNGGGTQYMSTAHSISVPFVTTYDVWVKLATASIPNNEEWFIATQHGTNDYLWLAYFNDAGTKILRLVGCTSGCGTIFFTRFTIPGGMDTAWHHIVGIFNGASSQTMYYDGTVISTSSTGGTSASPSSFTEMVVGGQSSACGGVCKMNGSIGPVRVLNYAPTSDWITTEYRNESNPGGYITLGSRQGSPSSVRHRVINGEN